MMLDWLLALLTDWGALVRPYIRDLALAMVATGLVVFGDDVNRFVRRLLAGWHMFWRTVVFILLCTFGYGALTLWLTPIVAKKLATVSNLWLPWLCLGIFTLLGLMAQRNRQA